jgi:hypothetical protein
VLHQQTPLAFAALRGSVLMGREKLKG